MPIRNPPQGDQTKRGRPSCCRVRTCMRLKVRPTFLSERRPHLHDNATFITPIGCAATTSAHALFDGPAFRCPCRRVHVGMDICSVQQPAVPVFMPTSTLRTKCSASGMPSTTVAAFIEVRTSPVERILALCREVVDPRGKQDGNHVAQKQGK